MMVRQKFFYLTKSLRETRKSKNHFQNRTFSLKFLQSPSSLDIMTKHRSKGDNPLLVVPPDSPPPKKKEHGKRNNLPKKVFTSQYSSK